MEFKDLILSDDARLLFGKKEQEIIRKQLNGEKLNQSQRNVLSRNIRKKLKFIDEISQFKEEFNLSINQGNKKIIRKTKRLLLNDKLASNIKAIFLFGSQASKTNTFRSDIDICVMFDKEFTKKEIFDFRIRILSESSSKVDLQIFNNMPIRIQKSIILNNKILYKRKDFTKYELMTKKLRENDYFLRMDKIFEVEI